VKSKQAGAYPGGEGKVVRNHSRRRRADHQEQPPLHQQLAAVATIAELMNLVYINESFLTEHHKHNLEHKS
jgi:hypothetical protein